MASSDEAEILFIEIIVVVSDVSHRNHTLAMVLVDSCIDTIAGNTADVGIEFFTKLVAHEFYHLVFDTVTLRILCYLLHFRTMFAKFLIMLLIGASATFCIFGKQTMNHCVRITADRRRKVGVILEGKSEVSDVVNRVLRFHHGTECYHLDEVVFWFTFTVGHQFVEASCRSALGTFCFHLIAELNYEFAQSFQLLWVWIIMDTIRQSLRLLTFLCLADALCHRAVGKEHEFLYQFVGIL